MRKQLRELRKEAVKPVSKMRKADIASEIERLGEKRETTPPVASVGGAPPKKRAPAVESIKKAKMTEFPVKPSDGGSKGKVKAPPSAAAPKAKLSKAQMMAMLSEMSDSDEE